MKLRRASLYIAVVASLSCAATSLGCKPHNRLHHPYPARFLRTEEQHRCQYAELKSTWYSGYRGCIIIVANFVTIDLSGYVITGP